jgi:purine-nucleoside phosphorylase
MQGHFIYEDLIISQVPNIKVYFEKLFNELKPKQILEIGTFDGGLTLMMRDILDEINLSSTTIRTYDLNDQKRLKSKNRNIEILTENLFSYSYSELEKEDVVKEFIQRNGRTIVLCDGGSKKNEFRLLSKFLKLDDIIMAHDYAPNENYFNQHINNKIWNWLEIQDSDINESCEQYNLIPYMEEELRNVVWVCKIKQ